MRARAVSLDALAWGSAQQIEAEKANLAALETRLSVARIENGQQAFAAANAAVQAVFAADPLIVRFQAEAAGQGK